MELSNHQEKLDALSRIKTNQQKYETEKKERHGRFVRLQQERQQILQEREEILNRLQEDKNVRFPHSRQSNMSINAALDRARDKIPFYEGKIRENADSNEVRKRMLQHPYRGELGIGSYEPWQLEDFYFVREFVQSWLDEILDFIIIAPCSDYTDNLTCTTNELQGLLDQEQSSMEFTKCAKEVQMTILGEACDELIAETIDESLAIHYQSRQAVMNMITNAVVHGETDENTTTLISNTYNQMKKERNKHTGLWHHSQKFDYLGDETVEMTSEEDDTFDGKVLSFEGITPIENIPDQALSQDFKSYRFLESKFWSGNTPTLSHLPLPRRYKGVSCMALSSDHSLLAIGTVQGDIAVWNLLEYPPRIIKGCKGNSSISNIHWSIDSTQIVTINQRGSIQIWSLAKGGSDTIIDIKAFEPVTNDGYQPTLLICEISLEPKDLVFTQGNLTSATSVVSRPSCLVFHPCLTFLGRQESLVVGLSSGNIIKLNFGENMSSSTHRVTSTDTVNRVGKGIDAELFKAHKDPIKLIGFIDNTSHMVTVDAQGFIYLWEYSDDNLSGYGWFTPSSSYRLDMTQKTYKPVEGSTEKVEFVDVVKGTGRLKELNRQDVIVKRKQMQTFINSLHLGKPWKTTDIGNQKVNYLYAPRSVPESGATFHSVTYYKDSKVLAQYSTQLYRPITITTTKMMSCKMNALGNKIVFSLLFGEVPPKVPHTAFVTIELPCMKIASNLIEVPLSDEDYKQCEVDDCCGFDMSRRIDATGVEYMFTNICGVIGGFSMMTTNLIMASSERGWVGCALSDDQSTVFNTAKVVVASQVVGLCIVFYSPKQSLVNLLHIKDDNPKSQRLQVWQAFCKLQDIREGVHPRESVRKHPWTLNGNTAGHLECTIESLVLDLVDKAIQESTDQEPDYSAHSLENRVLPFLRRCRQGVSKDNGPANSDSSIGLK